MKLEEYPYEPKNVMVNDDACGLISREKSGSNSNTFTLQLFKDGIEKRIGYIWASSKSIISSLSSSENIVYNKYIEVEWFEIEQCYRGKKIGKLLFSELVDCGKKCEEYAYIHGYYANGNPKLAKYYKEELLCKINYNDFSFRRAL
jgi:GNAT superfamily N-acetyltransferase